jgi:mono/diheme cytochrome c family protein
MRRIFGVLAASIVLVAATPAMGGWAVITVKEPPDQLVVGEPTTLAFTVLRHGQTPMAGLKPTVTLKRRDAGWLKGRQRFTAVPGPERGSYVATVIPEEVGEILITIDAEWHDARITLLPLRAVAAGQARAPVVSAADRGRILYVAKGCVACHAKRDDGDVQERHQVAAGPDLTGRAFAADWLATKLADPAKNRIRMNEWVVMPDLKLADAEIAALVEYVSGGGIATRD